MQEAGLRHHLDQLRQQRRRHRRAAERNPAQARYVAPAAIRMFEQHSQHGRHGAGDRDLVAFDPVQHQRGIETRQDGKRSRRRDHGDRQPGRADVKQRTRDQRD